MGPPFEEGSWRKGRRKGPGSTQTESREKSRASGLKRGGCLPRRGREGVLVLVVLEEEEEEAGKKSEGGGRW